MAEFATAFYSSWTPSPPSQEISSSVCSPTTDALQSCIRQLLMLVASLPLVTLTWHLQELLPWDCTWWWPHVVKMALLIKIIEKTLALPLLLYFGFMSRTGYDVGFCFGKTHLHVCNISLSLFSAIIVYCCYGNITSQQRVTHPTLQLKSNNCSKCHIELTTRTLSMSCGTQHTGL